MGYSREVLLTQAKETHDEEVGEKHCDRKYLEVCHVFVNAILSAPAALQAKEKSREAV